MTKIKIKNLFLKILFQIMFYDDKASHEVSQASDITFKTSIYQRNNNTSKSKKIMKKIPIQIPKFQNTIYPIQKN